MNPTIGRIVHYQPDTHARDRVRGFVPPSALRGPWAAIITGVTPAAGGVAEMVDLVAFPPGLPPGLPAGIAPVSVADVPMYDEAKMLYEQAGGTWRWPPRA